MESRLLLAIPFFQDSLFLTLLPCLIVQSPTSYMVIHLTISIPFVIMDLDLSKLSTLVPETTYVWFMQQGDKVNEDSTQRTIVLLVL